MTRGRFAMFAAASMGLSLLMILAGLLGVDSYAHARAERSAGLNRWGYRGPVLGAKRPGEMRIAVLGGSTVFGYGGPWHEAFPALLEGMLDTPLAPRPVHVANLGFNNEGAYAFLPTLQDFAYLDYDIVCLYEGYNDLPGDDKPNTAVFRHESPVFRLTGYFPILPAVLREKALLLRSGGQLDAAYRAERGEEPAIVFRPTLRDRTSAAAIEAVSSVSNALSRQLDRVSQHPATSAVAEGQARCARPWAAYCEAVYRATAYARSIGKRVLFVGQPRVIDGTARARHIQQQLAVAEMLERQFGGDAGVRYLDLGQEVDLSDRNLAFDEMHLGLDGNRVIARALVEPVLDLVRRMDSPK